ncbi:efflux RND transporter periplasmic adaptor subunit [Pseudomonas parafulva]|uniref:efflux RND transporter periplasmic adaptor subunit n=1 Tax=Pseudomonas TaxID=286 RepID=UPI000F78162A|nr:MULTISPECIES: efflux RND transporter periplasmic adaptor subunit [Pseudomonas]KAB5623221.1 efflux RND transporter periplasmic adaptor subunit [Pseudomonas putida]MBH3462535.1 efflux RND transporter periplasmic adaptor subunit [Pseudomonas putida]RSC27166.1 efflux RND transporter periplasmic adaptor subunit [Pseudomonas putida]HEK0909869.1 efflux RND transporter periplasmic adaptor subunit [Pseudomonas putida]HEK1771108.1 efflux RND transporter periplasmic adaptor subunit [Pseudomonas putida
MLRRASPLVLPLACLLLLTACGQEAAAPAAPRPALVIQPQPTGASADSYPGEVRARFEPELAFRIGGKVSKRLVEEGQRVKADQPLAELDPQDVRLQLEANRAQMAAAEANLSLVRAERDRYQKLLDRQMVSHSQFDNAENLYRAGLARLKQAKAEFDVAGNQAEYAVLRAPQNGVIAKRQVEVGQVVAAGQTVFTLAADGEREVAIGLPEQQFARFSVGQAVSVELWSHPEQRFEGRIRELSPAADPRSRTFAARIAFTSTQAPAELGQSAKVYIAHAEHSPLSVPLSAVTAEQGQAYVWRVGKDNRLERAPVRLGPYGADSVPVLEGLGANDWVVAAGGHVLREGQEVRPVDRSNRVVNLATKE